MGLISHGIAAGIGYHLAQPAGRRQLTELWHRATELRERGRHRADGALAGLGERGWRRPRPDASLSATSAPDATVEHGAGRSDGVTGASGFGGTTVAEDSQAVITGIPAPPPAGRTAPPTAPTS
jgi:hypothetical protein